MMKHTITAGLLALLMLGAGACQHLEGKHEYTSLGIYLQVSAQLPPDRRTTVVISNPPMSITVSRLPEVREVSLEKAELVKTDSRRQLILQFDRHGRLAVENFTTERRGELYVLTLNNVAVAAPAIRDIIRDGRLAVDVDLPDEDLEKLVKGLNIAAKKAHSL